LIGERGKGVKTIATLFNITRVYNSCCAVGYMRRGLALANDYAHKRKAFGKLLVDHGLHVKTLAELQLRFETSFHLTFHVVKLLGKEELGKATEQEAGAMRLLIPLAKLFTAKEGVAIASEVLESFGGAGYIEDTGLPELLRNAQVLSIWEGTTNVLSLDALRAIKKENAGIYFLADLEGRLQKITLPELKEGKDAVTKATAELKKFFQLSASWTEEELNTKARDLALSLAKTFAASLLLEHAQWSAEVEKNHHGIVSASMWIKRGLIVPELLVVDNEKDLREFLDVK
jgi:hypothetical protein